jgi:MFS family permease
VYFSYGAQASVIPSTVADFWGSRYAGTNYGALFTAWGFAGILGPTIGGVLFDRFKNYGAAFYTAAALALVALICMLIARRPEPR